MMRAATAACASMTVGDIICQRISERKVDLKRTAIMAATGLCVVGPVNHIFFCSAEMLAPGASFTAVMKKAVFDLASAPLRLTCTFSSVVLLNGKGVAGVQQKLEDELWATYVTGAQIFPPLIVVMFKFVRDEWRAPIWAVVGSLWNVYLSYQAHKEGLAGGAAGGVPGTGGVASADAPQSGGNQGPRRTTE